MEEFEIDREALLTTFMAEAEEILARMEGALLALEAAPGDGELLNTVFRDTHTLKGGAALLGFGAMRELAHDLEHVLDRLRKHELGVTEALVTLLLTSVDVLRAALADAAGGLEGPSEATAGFQASLAAAASAAAGVKDPPRAPASAATAAPASAAETPPPAATSAAAPAPTLEASHPAAGTPAAPQRATARTLRVDVARLGKMLDLSGEIAIARGRLTVLLERKVTDLNDRRQGLTVEEVLAAHREADRLFMDLQELIMKARMVPIGPVFTQHVRTVRDLAAAQGKQAQLVMEGADVEVDTSVVEQIRDPLMHMVRNAVDHGMEPPAARVAAGKPALATLTLRAYHDAGSMVIEVVDDGAGLDRARIARKAMALGLIQEGDRITDEILAQVIFEPGFSTNEVVTEVSGRGVGMDVVRRNVEALRGSVAVSSAEGRGTTVTIRVPLTLAIIQGFRVSVAGQSYIVPLDAVVECMELPAEKVGEATAGVLDVRGKPLPFLRLRAHFGQKGPRGDRESVVLVRQGASTAGLAVDALHGESSTVIKPLGAMFKNLPGVAGSSIMGDGRVALILDVGGLLREAHRNAAGLLEARSA